MTVKGLSDHIRQPVLRIEFKLPEMDILTTFFTILSLITGVFFFRGVLLNPFRAFLMILPVMAITRSISIPFVGERLILFDLGLLLFLIGLLFRRLKTGPLKKSGLPGSIFFPSIIYYFFLVSTVLSLVSATLISKGVFEIGVYLSLGIWGIVAIVIVNTENRMHRVAEFIPWIVFIVILIALTDFFLASRGIELLSRRSGFRLSGTFRNPNQLAVFLTLLLPFVWSKVVFNPPKGIKLILFVTTSVMGILTVFMTSSRTNIFVLVFQIILFILISVWRSPGKTRSLAIFVFIGALFVLSLPLVKTKFPDSWQLFENRISQTVSGILKNPANALEETTSLKIQQEFLRNNWGLALIAFLEHPLTGTGIANFGQTYHIIQGIVGTEVHSQYGIIIAETGFFGIFFFLIFLIIIVFRMIQLLRSDTAERWIAAALCVALLGVMVGGIYNIFFRRREFWFIVGLILSYWDMLFSAPQEIRLQVKEKNLATVHS